MAVVIIRECGNAVRLLLVFAVLTGGVGCAAASEAQPAPSITQRHINDYSAALERCRRKLLIDPGIRLHDEPLPAYILRISARLPGEDVPHYKTRLSAYVDALASATDSTASLRSLPALKSSSASNTALVMRASRDLSYLPKRMERVRLAAKAATANNGAAPAKALASEMLTTIQLILDAYSNLRDARP